MTLSIWDNPITNNPVSNWVRGYISGRPGQSEAPYYPPVWQPLPGDSLSDPPPVSTGMAAFHSDSSRIMASTASTSISTPGISPPSWAHPTIPHIGNTPSPAAIPTVSAAKRPAMVTHAKPATRVAKTPRGRRGAIKRQRREHHLDRGPKRRRRDRD